MTSRRATSRSSAELTMRTVFSRRFVMQITVDKRHGNGRLPRPHTLLFHFVYCAFLLDVVVRIRHIVALRHGRMPRYIFFARCRLNALQQPRYRFAVLYLKTEQRKVA